jgi:outer membrane protein OmpA-like peptidoglycan-associated protein
MRRLIGLFLASLVMAFLSSVAQAQDAQGSAFSLQNFRPAIDSKGYVTVNASSILGHLDFSLGLVGSYAHNVMQLQDSGRSFQVEHFLTPQLQAALGLFKWIELGLSLPVHVMFGARAPAFVEPANMNLNNDLHFSGQFIGDIGMHLKARFLNTSRYPVGLGALLSVYAPSGKSDQFLGEGQVTIRPELIIDKEFGRTRRFRLALNAGALIRPATHTFEDRGTTLAGDPYVDGGKSFCAPAAEGVVAAPSSCGTGLARALGTQLTYGLGLSFAAVPQRLDLVGEAFGYADVTGNHGGQPLEALLALKVYLASKSYFEIGGGAGLIPGMTGSPDVRVFLGFIFEPAIGDRDGDGIKDDVDKCPDEPEDFDGFEDEDGCPDPDNDKDGILDVDDRCPNVPGPVENHGCPWPDRDKDGILDKDDACPDVPGPVENHGCPWPDRDKDGIFDQDDACPDEPGPVENHGCPYRDSDGDGLLDKDDECPHRPGPKENHGCPPTSVTRLRGSTFVVLKPIFFETAKAIIKPISYPTLDDVAETMRENPQLLVIEIQGHADERGDDDFNMRLTEDRAVAVRTYLIGKGVASDRLMAHGYGETRPICHRHDEECWSKNRRVEFVILRRTDNPVRRRERRCGTILIGEISRTSSCRASPLSVEDRKRSREPIGTVVGGECAIPTGNNAGSRSASGLARHLPSGYSVWLRCARAWPGRDSRAFRRARPLAHRLAVAGHKRSTAALESIVVCGTRTLRRASTSLP